MRSKALFLVGLLCVAPLSAQSDQAKDHNGTLVEVTSGRLNTDVPIPTFKVDAAWPRLPENMILGQVSGLAIDRDDNVWIANRPNALGFSDIGRDATPPITEACCSAPPHILQFDQQGNLVRGWGGPELAPGESKLEGRGRSAVETGDEQWPRNIHGIFVDPDLNVWFGGNGPGDHAVLQFTPDGEYIRQIGQRQTPMAITPRNFSAIQPISRLTVTACLSLMVM